MISGEARGSRASIARALLRILEPVYCGGVSLRNLLYDWKILAAKKLPRLVISIGNITTGGTGKTPMVAWLARQLRSAGQRPAVLLRGYRERRGIPGDEEQLLDLSINRNSTSE